MRKIGVNDTQQPSSVHYSKMRTLWSVLVVLGLGQTVCHRDTAVSKSKRSSQPDDVRRGTFNGFLGESSEPWTNRVLFVGRDCFCDLKGRSRVRRALNHQHCIGSILLSRMPTI